MLNNTVHLVRGRDLYVPPADVSHGIMLGVDKKKLCREWDKAVKKKAMTVLNEYSRYFSAKEEPDSDGEGPVEMPRQQPQDEPETIPSELVAPATSQVQLQPSSVVERGEVNAYPRACKVHWKEIEMFLPRFVATWFKAAGTHIYARAIYGSDYSERNNGWAIILEDVSPEDRPYLKTLLERYDKLKEVDIDSEWPEKEPVWFNSFPLTTAISNAILSAELLESLPLPFHYGIQMTVPLTDCLVLISDGVSL